jgi:Deltex C-terminal domain
LRYVVPNQSSRAAAAPYSPENADAKIFIGTMPSGSMRVDELPGLACSGHSRGIFAIKYRLDAGVEKAYHDHPGEPFEATNRDAYLPNTAAGRELLERLIIAFTYGLTFRIGPAKVTKGPSKSVIKWASIPHKTSLSPGTFGYPDASYFQSAHAELDALGVPGVIGLRDTST